MRTTISVRRELFSIIVCVSLTFMFAQRQKLQYDPSSSCPRRRKSGNNSSDGPNTPLISENLPVPASPSVIRTTGAHYSHGTTGYASYIPGFDFPDSSYNNANEYSYPPSSSIGPPYQHVSPPMNLIPSLTGFSQCGSSSSSGSFVCENLPFLQRRLHVYPEI